jgi:hypothetical protein
LLSSAVYYPLLSTILYSLLSSALYCPLLSTVLCSLLSSALPRAAVYNTILHAVFTLPLLPLALHFSILCSPLCCRLLFPCCGIPLNAFFYRYLLTVNQFLIVSFQLVPVAQDVPSCSNLATWQNMYISTPSFSNRVLSPMNIAHIIRM